MSVVDSEEENRSTINLQLHKEYFVVRHSPLLTAPAIFLSWEDCSKHISNCADYQRFATPLQALRHLSTYITKNPTTTTATPKDAEEATTTLAKDDSPDHEEGDAPMNDDDGGGVTENTKSTATPSSSSSRVQRFEKKFTMNLERLRKYRATHATTIPDDTNDDPYYKGLKRWVLAMRHEMFQFQSDRDTLLDQEKVEQLQSLGIVCRPNRKSADYFDTNCQRLQAYVLQYQTDAVPTTKELTTEQEQHYTGLGYWVRNVRAQVRLFQKGQPSSLDEPQVQRLLDAGLTTEHKRRPAKKTCGEATQPFAKESTRITTSPPAVDFPPGTFTAATAASPGTSASTLPEKTTTTAASPGTSSTLQGAALTETTSPGPATATAASIATASPGTTVATTTQTTTTLPGTTVATTTQTTSPGTATTLPGTTAGTTQTARAAAATAAPLAFASPGATVATTPTASPGTATTTLPRIAAATTTQTASPGTATTTLPGTTITYPPFASAAVASQDPNNTQGTFSPAYQYILPQPHCLPTTTTPTASFSRAQRFDKKFSMNLARLQKYREQHPDDADYQNLRDDDDGNNNEFKGLRRWYLTMRHEMFQFKSNRKSPLDQEKVEQLQSVGIYCRADRKSAEYFDSNCERLQAYVLQYKTDAVPTTKELTTDDDRQKYTGLGYWVKYIRAQTRLFQKGKESTVNEEQVKRLLAAGLTTEHKGKGAAGRAKPAKKPILPEDLFRDHPMWNEHFAALVAYKETNGHMNVPQKPPSELSRFIARTRNDYEKFKEGKPSALNGDRLRKLTEIEFQFTTATRKSWNERALEWLEFYTKHGRHPHLDMEGGIGKWASKMRRHYRLLNEGKPSPSLTREQANQLTGWGFVWESPITLPAPATEPRQSWEERYQQLLEYKEEYGNCLVPQSYPGLGQWTKRMRKEYQKLQREGVSNLKERQIELLTQAGFVFKIRDSRRGQLQHHGHDDFSDY